MTEVARNCSASGAFEVNRQVVAEQVWEALLLADCFVEGQFIFASGRPATLKVEAENLYSHREQLDTVLGLYAAFPCVEDSDLLLYVPHGPMNFTVMLAAGLNKPVAHTRRIAGSNNRYDFQFVSSSDRDLAQAAVRPLIVEDVVTTLGSVAALRSLLPEDKEVHSLAMLLRGTVNPDYRTGLVDHYLLERPIPTDKDEFKHRLSRGWL